MSSLSVTENQLTAVADRIGVTVSRTQKSGKVAWQLTRGKVSTVVQGTGVTLAVLNLMDTPKSCASVSAPDYTLYAEPIVVRKGTFDRPKVCTQATMAICDNPTMSAEDIQAVVQTQSGVSIAKNTVTMLMCDVRKTLKYLQSRGRLLVA